MAPLPRYPYAATPSSSSSSGNASVRPRSLDPATAQRMAMVCAKRLRYAHFKVQNGWAKQTLAEVENLYYKQRTDPVAAPQEGDVFGPYASVAPATAQPTGSASSILRSTAPTPIPAANNNNSGNSNQKVLNPSSAFASNRLLGQESPVPPSAAVAHSEGFDNMSLLAHASLMAPPASTPQPGLKSSNNVHTPPRRSTAALMGMTPGTGSLPLEPEANWSASGLTTPNSFVAPVAAREKDGLVGATSGTMSSTAQQGPDGEAAAPSNYASFWAHVGSMGGLGTSTPADPRKRGARPSLPSETDSDTPMKRLRLAGV